MLLLVRSRRLFFDDYNYQHVKQNCERTGDVVNANTGNVINIRWEYYCVAIYAGHRYSIRK